MGRLCGAASSGKTRTPLLKRCTVGGDLRHGSNKVDPIADSTLLLLKKVETGDSSMLDAVAMRARGWVYDPALRANLILRVNFLARGYEYLFELF